MKKFLSAILVVLMVASVASVAAFAADGAAIHVADDLRYPFEKSILFFTGFQIRVTFKPCLPFKVVVDGGNNRLAVRAILLFVHPL